jgi:hypothetical protein
MNQRKVFAQIEFRERGQDTTKDQEGEKGDQRHRKELVGKDIAKTLHPLEIGQDAIKDDKGATPKGKPDGAQKKNSETPAFPGF